MSLLGSGLLAFWHDVAPGGDDDFNHWHLKEHIPERVGVPGFLRGRRYTAVDAPERYVVLYETRTLDVLDSPDYVARLNNPTPWTRRVLGLFRDSNRTAFQIGASVGQGIGGALATLRFGPEAGREAELRDWLTGAALPALVERPPIVAAALGEADVETTRVPTEERRLRQREDEIARWVLLVDGSDPESVAAACREALGPATLEAHGAAPGLTLGIYRLVYCLAE